MTDIVETSPAPASVAARLFGPWRFDPKTRQLARLTASGGYETVTIGSRAAYLLALLLAEPGALVPKRALMNAAWPGVIVEQNNLTVQITALRRLLDEDRSQSSCIVNVPGQGYRFGLHTEHGPVDASMSSPTPAAPLEAATPPEPARQPRLTRKTFMLAGILLAAIGLASGWRESWSSQAAVDPRFSIAVMPFENLSGSPQQDYLAEAMTDDLTNDLARGHGAYVTVRAATAIYKGQTRTARQVGQDLGVRYMLEGSIRQQAGALHINADLVATETGGRLWSDQFYARGADLGAAQETAVQRIRTMVHIALLSAEASRSARERPRTPTAIDLFVLARYLNLQPVTPQRVTKLVSLYERALQLDPLFVPALLALSNALLDDQEVNSGNRKLAMERTSALLTRARRIDPTSADLLAATTRWFSFQDDRCEETIDAARSAIDGDSTQPATYRWLGRCLTFQGRPAEAVPLLERAIALEPHNAWQFHNYAVLADAMLLLGRYDDCIRWNERALTANPDASNVERASRLYAITAAQVLNGQVDQGRTALAEATVLWPYRTIRGFAALQTPDPMWAAQIDRIKQALRLAGLRDHADEAKDAGVQPTAQLTTELASPTATTAPGVITIGTPDLVKLLAERKPLVVDTAQYASGQSIQGAVGLRYAGDGGDYADAAQDHLRAKMQQLTGGNREAPIVAVGWNPERSDGRNLALRLAALGYTTVYWYRGGRETWESLNLPEGNLAIQTW